MTKTIGFVGFGNMNSIMAELAVKEGYRVVLSNSRGPSSLSASVAKLGPLASAAEVEDAVEQSDFVSVSIPLKNVFHLPVKTFAGKIVIDTMNYYPERDGSIEELDERVLTTSEMVQRHLEGSVVVKAFHNIDQFHFRSGPRPVGDPERWALPIASDSANGKEEVSAFMAAIGFDPVDCGSLAESWRIQQNTAPYSTPYIGKQPKMLNLASS
ncbi:NADP oxidoreductase [Phytophthora cinnamomi]|uniref:NADP oxidoreductase n=1 Tax=Phytophthora cinnamomi TaxID=4785 RepID=UPI00355AA505|nr:NADP oxidoreductase [Phytophthora cinnamomi]